MTTPVRIPPIAAGRMMFQVVRHFVTPSARLASRRLAGRSRASPASLGRTIGSMRIASANAP
jgi:hypothetical protein